MFKILRDILTSPCLVYKIKDRFVYSIFKNGSSSMNHLALTNQAIKLENINIVQAETIEVYLRDPVERFISGLSTYAFIQKIDDIQGFLKDVQVLKIVDKHFVPQYFWLLALAKYHKGSLSFKDFVNFGEICKVNIVPWKENPYREKIQKHFSEEQFKSFLEIDKMMRDNLLGKTRDIKEVVQEYKNVLS